MIGEQIDNYRILDKLGEGAMGVVYKALDLNLERVVALKLMNAGLSHHPDLEARFRSEARTQATLNHQNIATLYSFLTWEGKAVMVMEYVDGKTLQQMVAERGALPPATAMALCKQALYGVGAAHKQNIVHRDLKPGNLMLSKDGVIKVMDFGIAKIKGGAGLKGTAMAIGTYDYMAPEQALNKAVDSRADIYSMGITLYEILTGDVPFQGDSGFAVQMAHMNDRPRNPTERNPAVPQSVADVVMKALEKNPDDRFQTTDEFIRALPRLSDASGQMPRQQVPVRDTVVDTGVFKIAPPPDAGGRPPSHPPMPLAEAPATQVQVPPFAPVRQGPFDQPVLNPHPYIAGPAVIPPPPMFVKQPKKSNMGVLLGGAAVVFVAIALVGGWIYFKPKPAAVIVEPAKATLAPAPGQDNGGEKPGKIAAVTPSPVVNHPPVDKPVPRPDTTPPPEKHPDESPTVPPPIVNRPTTDTGLAGAWKGSYLDSGTQQSTEVDVVFQGSNEHLTGKASFTLPDQTSGECSVSSSRYDPTAQMFTLSYTSCTGASAPAYLHSLTTFASVDPATKRLKNGRVYGMPNVHVVFAKHGL